MPGTLSQPGPGDAARRENGSGRLPTPIGSWAWSPSLSLVPGPDLQGSRTVASSTPVRLRFPDRGPRAASCVVPA